MKKKQYRKFLTCLLVVLISSVLTTFSAQSNAPSLKKDFYKSNEFLKKDVETYEYFKKSRRQKRTATVVGVLSLISIGSGTYLISQHQSTGQSADVAIVVPILGLYSIGAASGITALIFNFAAMRNRNKTINLYQEKFGTGFILNENQYENYVIRANLNGNGIGMILSF